MGSMNYVCYALLYSSCPFIQPVASEITLSRKLLVQDFISFGGKIEQVGMAEFIA
jgi:hypothetical protein